MCICRTLTEPQHLAYACYLSDLTLPSLCSSCSLRGTWRRSRPPASNWIWCRFCRIHFVRCKWLCKQLLLSVRPLRRQSITDNLVEFLRSLLVSNAYKPNERYLQGPRCQRHLSVKLRHTHDDGIWPLRSEYIGGYGRQQGDRLLVLISPRIGRHGKYEYDELLASITLLLALSEHTHR